MMMVKAAEKVRAPGDRKRYTITARRPLPSSLHAIALPVLPRRFRVTAYPLLTRAIVCSTHAPEALMSGVNGADRRSKGMRRDGLVARAAFRNVV